jgi:hypothetical protein
VGTIKVEGVAPTVRGDVARGSRADPAAGREAANRAAGEWARGEARTNTSGSYFSASKRGMRKGVHQRCGEARLHRYLAEFGSRCNHRAKLGVDDAARADQLNQEHRRQATHLEAV